LQECSKNIMILLPRNIEKILHSNHCSVERLWKGAEMADTYKACQPFLPLSSTVLFGRFATAKCPHRTPQKISVKLGGYLYANCCIWNTNQYQ